MIAITLWVFGALTVIASGLWAIPKIFRFVWFSLRWISNLVRSMDRFSNVAPSIVEVGEAWRDNGGPEFFRKMNALHQQLMPPGGKCVMDKFEELSKSHQVIDADNKKCLVQIGEVKESVRTVDEKVGAIKRQVEAVINTQGEKGGTK